MILLAIAVLPLTYYLPEIKKEGTHVYVNVALYTLLILIVSVTYINNLMEVGESSFIYFQF